MEMTGGNWADSVVDFFDKHGAGSPELFKISIIKWVCCIGSFWQLHLCVVEWMLLKPGSSNPAHLWLWHSISTCLRAILSTGQMAMFWCSQETHKLLNATEFIMVYFVIMHQCHWCS